MLLGIDLEVAPGGWRRTAPLAPGCFTSSEEVPPGASSRQRWLGATTGGLPQPPTQHTRARRALYPHREKKQIFSCQLRNQEACLTTLVPLANQV